MAINKVVYGENVLVDLTGDTVTPDKLLVGETAHNMSGEPITGTLEPSPPATAQEKTINPSAVKQTVLPDEGVDYLSQVVVNPIPYVEADNSAGGTTVTIGG